MKLIKSNLAVLPKGAMRVTVHTLAGDVVLYQTTTKTEFNIFSDLLCGQQARKRYATPKIETNAAA